eukprot:CAMPEP_0177416322 /NCGR_PEP_ID=MMETSP0368-20130122/68041_1 /TAXON_ID=447022 ORGANISM="Scrippsiella hangoei-like, Strain SHHI-4" /NCGR_SAMPLE_ID=MMETSP0368 /ASSEMBLY_ACC=CAM_ASM_000363 /LENGTH=39 /DNA_ID= /DNA_START= /DNA_END= /DNA_ORIENTATION=
MSTLPSLSTPEYVVHSASVLPQPTISAWAGGSNLAPCAG